jgi:hypothetical protein
VDYGSGLRRQFTQRTQSVAELTRSIRQEPQSGKSYCYSSENLLVGSGGTCAAPTTALGYDPALRLYSIGSTIQPNRTSTLAAGMRQ